VNSNAQEETRLRARRTFVDETVCSMKEHIQGMLTEWIFTSKEAGICDWENQPIGRRIITISWW
jgi:hypothetical protein